MSRDVIATDQPITPAQAKRLAALLDTLLPASADGTMPSAGELNFPGYLQQQAADFTPALQQILEAFDDEFAALPLSRRCTLAQDFSRSQIDAFNGLVFHVYNCYYQDDRVRELIGSKPGAPFPDGNPLEPGDLSLLDPVVRQSRSYRKA